MNGGLLTWLELRACSLFEGLIFYSPCSRLGFALGGGGCEFHGGQLGVVSGRFGRGRVRARCRLAQGLRRIGVRRYLRDVSAWRRHRNEISRITTPAKRQPDECRSDSYVSDLHGKNLQPRLGFESMKNDDGRGLSDIDHHRDDTS